MLFDIIPFSFKAPLFPFIVYVINILILIRGIHDIIYSLIASIGLDSATRQLLKLTVHIVMTKVINRGRIKTFNPMGAL